MKKIKIGIIGAGAIARQHLEVIKSVECMEVIGMTSRTMMKAETLAKEFGIKKCFSNMESLVKETSPDGLMMLVSQDQMLKVVSKAMDYNMPLFIEKPAGLTPDENLKLLEKSKERKIPNMVGFNRRFYSVFHKGMDIIRKHGPLMGVFVEGHERMWRVRKGGYFSEEVLDKWIFANSVHTIDLLRFFGGEPEDFSSISYRHCGESRGDQFAAIMRFSGGAIGQYSAHWYSPGGWRAVLYGDGVTVEFKPLEKGIWIDRDFNTHDIEPDISDINFKPGFLKQIEAFGNLIKYGKTDSPASDLESSYKTMLLAEEISSDIKTCPR